MKYYDGGHSVVRFWNRFREANKSTITTTRKDKSFSDYTASATVICFFFSVFYNSLAQAFSSPLC